MHSRFRSEFHFRVWIPVPICAGSALRILRNGVCERLPSYKLLSTVVRGTLSPAALLIEHYALSRSQKHLPGFF